MEQDKRVEIALAKRKRLIAEVTERGLKERAETRSKFNSRGVLHSSGCALALVKISELAVKEAISRLTEIYIETFDGEFDEKLAIKSIEQAVDEVYASLRLSDAVLLGSASTIMQQADEKMRTIKSSIREDLEISLFDFRKKSYRIAPSMAEGTKKLELLTSLRTQAGKLPLRDDDGLAKFKTRAEMVIRQVFGRDEAKNYIEGMHNIEFDVLIASDPPLPESVYNNQWSSGKKRLIALCDTMLEHLDLSGDVHAAPPNPARKGSEKRNMKIFIGHGGSLVWRVLKDFLHDRLKLDWDEFNREPTAGTATKERLEQMLNNAGFAFLVMTAEDEHADKTKHARESVIHEIGLFQGRLGFKKAIILLEEGCAEFSNIVGLTQIRFPKGKIDACFEEVRRVLEREGVL